MSDAKPHDPTNPSHREQTCGRCAALEKALAKRQHDDGCHPSEGRHSAACLEIRALLKGER